MVIAIAAFFIALVIGTHGRQPSLDLMLNSNGVRIHRIVLRPADRALPTLSAPVEITEQAKIAKLSTILRESKKASTNHPQIVWICHVEVASSEKSAFGTLALTSTGEGFLDVHSKPESGWMYGTFRNDRLVQSIAAQGLFVEDVQVSINQR